MASLPPVTVPSLAATGNLNALGTISLGGLTAAGLNNTGNMVVTGASALTGLTTASGGINVVGNKTLNFGSDQTKATNAGSIGYQFATAGALDFFGAGTGVGSRGLQFWDNITVPGTSTLTGKATANGGWVVTGGLTVDGQAVNGASTSKQVAWTTVYTNGSHIAQYSIDALGVVRLRGGFITQNAGQVVFTLPAGACPPKLSNFSIALKTSSSVGACVMTITQAGAVSTNAGLNYITYVDNVNYDSSAT